MIKLQIEEYCHDCPEFEPETDIFGFASISDGECSHYNIYVRCKHRDRCRSVYNHIKNNVKPGDCDKAYRCPTCKWFFSDRAAIRTETVSGDVMYICPHCNSNVTTIMDKPIDLEGEE